MGGAVRMLKRWQHLMQRLIAEEGSQQKAARAAGKTQSTVGRWAKGERVPSLDEVDSVLKRLRISPRYLTAEGPDDLDYRPFLTIRGSGAPERYHPALARFTATEQWHELEDHHRETLIRFAPVGAEPTVETYRGLAVLLRSTTNATVLPLGRKD